MSDEKRGLYRKYDVKRTDGSSGPGGKHEHCAYFVLDLEHDPFAIPALRAYAEAARDTGLADDVGRIVMSSEASATATRLMAKEEPSDE